MRPQILASRGALLCRIPLRRNTQTLPGAQGRPIPATRVSREPAWGSIPERIPAADRKAGGAGSLFPRLVSRRLRYFSLAGPQLLSVPQALLAGGGETCFLRISLAFSPPEYSPQPQPS